MGTTAFVHRDGIDNYQDVTIKNSMSLNSQQVLRESIIECA